MFVLFLPLYRYVHLSLLRTAFVILLCMCSVWGYLVVKSPDSCHIQGNNILFNQCLLLICWSGLPVGPCYCFDTARDLFHHVMAHRSGDLYYGWTHGCAMWWVYLKSLCRPLEAICSTTFDPNVWIELIERIDQISFNVDMCKQFDIIL